MTSQRPTYKPKHKRLFSCFLYIVVILNILSIPLSAQHSPCGTDAYYAEKWSADDLTTMKEQMLSMNTSADLRNDIVLPVVVHVVYKNEEENISDIQIASQLEVLNREFNNKVDPSLIHPDFIDLIDVPNFNFKLACVDPEGNFTTGVTRTKTNIDNLGILQDNGQYRIHYDALGGKNPWPVDEYINIWVTDMGETLLGRATLPYGFQSPFENGVIISSPYFGDIIDPDVTDINGGKTLVHEMGHYFGLQHLWGLGSPSCLSDDFVDDTPQTENILYGCPKIQTVVSCGSQDMLRNHMGYMDDECLLYFTKGQTIVMKNILGEVRSGLLDNDKFDCDAPAFEEPQFFVDNLHSRIFLNVDKPAREIKLDLYNMNGQRISNADKFLTENGILSTTNFASGIYILTMEIEGKKFTKKIAILH